MMSLSKILPHRFVIGSCLIASSIILAGCGGHSIQTTSGKAYLERHKPVSGTASTTITPKASANGGISFDQALLQVADIEPTLAFPARIGIAKIGCNEGLCGELAPLSPEEASAWSDMATGLGSSFGTIVPLHPLALRQALSEAEKAGLDLQQTSVLDEIRLGAARQHLDAVIVYESRGKADTETSLLALADLTIIGAFVLPSRKIESKAYAAGIIIDPISGYPYGQLEAAAANDDRYTTSVSSSSNRKDAERDAEIDAAVALVAETEYALRELRLTLAEQRVAK